MKKIMFNDKFLRTQSVLDGNITQMISIVPQKILDMVEDYRYEYYNAALEGISVEDAIYALTHYEKRAKAPYYIDEEIAIAQRYSECFRAVCLENSKGWNNKMFVMASLMPHRIKITNIRVERLQDISNENCLKEGIERCEKKWGHWQKNNGSIYFYTFDTIREAFADLIDKVSGKGTWDSNPYVFVYDFELIK